MIVYFPVRRLYGLEFDCGLIFPQHFGYSKFRRFLPYSRICNFECVDFRFQFGQQRSHNRIYIATIILFCIFSQLRYLPP